MTDDIPDAQSVLVFTATYCEADNIEEWHRRVRQAVPSASIFVIDDNSPDGTKAKLERLAEQDAALTYMVRPGKLGLGSAHRVAMNHSLDHGFDILVTLDADLSHKPEEIPLLLDALPGRDFVIGTRSGEGTSDYSGFRRFASVGGNSLARLLIPTGLTEYTTSMRAFTRPSLEVLKTDGVKDEGYAFFMEVVYRLSVSGMRLGEVPITFMDRAYGTSKIPKNQIITSALVLGRLSADRLLRVWRRKPH